jgi:hypothetical protein
MNKLNEDILYTIKKLITDDNLIDLEEYYNQLKTSEEQIYWDYIYQKAYLHACLLHRSNIVEWITKLFENFDPITKIAMRHTFSYGKYLQTRNNPYLKSKNKN